jgi:hypothetical protein
VRKYIWTALAATLLGILVALGQGMCERAFGQDKPPVLTEVEKLKLVNTYQAAVLAQVDKQNADARANRTREAYMTLVEKMKGEHKWDPATQFEINSETGDVVVHLPLPTKDSKSTNPPAQGTKEKQP